MPKPLIKVGTVTGTGSAINIELGFIPSYFMIANITDGDTIDEWFDGMTAATNLRTTTAVATNASNGVTRYTGSRGSASQGVTIGTAISESAKVLRYIAVRGDD